MTGPIQDLFAFALNLYRAPLKYRSFIGSERPVPDNFQELLETLNKRPENKAWDELVESLSSSAEELREAGYFLVRRVLFVDGADHYRVLGLDRTSSVASIRERYRLLIRLFHPDKNPQGDEWGELYAPKINDAYTVLKNPHKKSNYDRQLSGVFDTATDRRPQSRTTGCTAENWGPDRTPAPSRDAPSADDFQGWDDPAGFANPFDADTNHEEQLAASKAPDAVPPRTEPTVPSQPARPGKGRNWLWGLVFLSGLVVGIVIGMRGDGPPQVVVQTDDPSVVTGLRPSPEDDPQTQDESKRAFEAALAQGSEPMLHPDSQLADTGVNIGQSAAAVGENHAYTVSAPDQPLVRVSPEAKKKTDRSDSAGCTGPHCEAVPATTQEVGADDSRMPSAEQAAQTTRVSEIRPDGMPMTEQPLSQTAVPAKLPQARPKREAPNSSISTSQVTMVEVPEQSARVAEKSAMPMARMSNEDPRQKAVAGTDVIPITVARAVRKQDVDRLIARFIQTYEIGDVGKFAALFSKDAVTNDGIGREVISTSYGELFAASEERSLHVTDLAWSGDQGGEATLSFVASISIIRGVFSTVEYYEGDINMRVFLYRQRLLISEFLHKVEKI